MVETVDEVLARISRVKLLVNNLFQRTDQNNRWQANLRTNTPGQVTVCCGWGTGETPVIALKNALAEATLTLTKEAARTKEIRGQNDAPPVRRGSLVIIKKRQTAT